MAEEFSYLSGVRLEASLTQQYRRGVVEASGWVRYRDERIGTLGQAASVLPTAACEGGCTAGLYVIPYGWAGPAAGVTAKWRPWERLLLRADADVEGRRYDGTGYLLLTGAGGGQVRMGERQREDVRLGGGVAATLRLGAGWEVGARYDVLVNASNVDSRLPSPAGACAAVSSTCHAWDATDANYVKHVVGLSAGWLF